MKLLLLQYGIYCVRTWFIWIFYLPNYAILFLYYFNLHTRALIKNIIIVWIIITLEWWHFSLKRNSAWLNQLNAKNVSNWESWIWPFWMDMEVDSYFLKVVCLLYERNRFNALSMWIYSAGLLCLKLRLIMSIRLFSINYNSCYSCGPYRQRYTKCWIVFCRILVHLFLIIN